MHPFHVQRVQELQLDNYAPPIAFACTLDNVLQIPFFAKVLISDEATFTWEGILNKHNAQMLAEENQHAI